MFLRNVDNRLLQQTFNCLRNYGKAVSAFSNFGNRNKDFKKRTSEDLVSVALENIEVTKPQDWDKVKQFVLDHELNNRIYHVYNKENIDGMIMGSLSQQNRLDMAKSYLKYLEEINVKPNLAAAGRYFRMLYDNKQEKMSKADEKEILDICNDIKQNNPVLDSRTLENMILALSLTKEWKLCIDSIQEIKKTSSVSPVAYSALIAAAFLNKEEQLAWDLLHETSSLERPVLSVAFLSYLKTLKKLRKKENIIAKLEQLFAFFRDSEMHCNEDVVTDIVHSFNLGHKATVKFSGHCENCNTKLEKLDLTDSEFVDLKDVFFKNALVGKDIFIKTNPEEMKKFEAFVANMQKYDVVLDGLNIAYSAGKGKGPHVYSKLLCSVVSHFAQQNKSVLMLGRVHMARWPRPEWNFIRENASIFLTQNISQDDPYLLFCAMQSGKDTIIVTKDLMRGHKFLLKEKKYKTLFNRWLSQRQYFLLNVNDWGKVFFRIPPPFSAVAQKNGNVWHIPYIPQADGEVNEMYHKTWLCLDCN